MTGVFQDLAPITRLLKGAFLLGGALNVVSFLSSLGQLSLLARDFTDAEADANDMREYVISAAVILVALATLVIFCIWIYRAATNVRALGANGLTISPGWAVGWFFVPIANFVMPFRAMRELWNASQSPASWASLSTAPIVGWWWALFLADQFVGRLAAVLYKRAETLEAQRVATGFDMISDIISLAVIAVAFVLVTQIADAQARARSTGA